jgi:hypothetical protein
VNAEKALHRLRAKETNGTAGAALSVVRDPPSGPKDARSGAAVAPGPSTSVGGLRTKPAVEAWALLAEPLKRKPLEGIRVGALGITGGGKTTGILSFLAYLEQQRVIDIFLVYDIKLPIQQYAGEVMHEAGGLLTAPPDRYPIRRVLRREDVDHTPDIETAARVTKLASYNGIPTMLVVDELKRATTTHGRQFTAPTVSELLTEGRALGASLLWGEQIPQRVPTAGFDQSQLMLFRAGRKALAYLENQNVIEPEIVEVVANLQVGQFVLVSADADFDGNVYQVPAP